MLAGFLVFADEPKAAARESLAQLAALGIEVKIATGDNPRVAEKVCAEMGLASKGTITGSQLESLDEDEFAAAAQNHTIFARITPEQKAHLVKSARRAGRSVGFLGDGVNDALALHAADVGISVDSATDVAKDAADVVLLEKDLGVLAAGVAEGRRIFANTMKYVLMGTSSNFGNMFSAAAASALLPFLPMLPSQILLNNLLYDTSQLAIPTDRVDEEQLHAPAHWNIAFIRRFMLTFGPISSLFDFLTFGLMLGVLHAGRDGVSHRLVRGIPCHADVDHLRDPHPQGAVLSQSPWRVVDFDHPHGGTRRRIADGFTVGPHLGFHTAAAGSSSPRWSASWSSTCSSSSWPRSCSTPSRCGCSARRIAPVAANIASTGVPRGSVITASRKPPRLRRLDHDPRPFVRGLALAFARRTRPGGPHGGRARGRRDRVAGWLACRRRRLLDRRHIGRAGTRGVVGSRGVAARPGGRGSDRGAVAGRHAARRRVLGGCVDRGDAGRRTRARGGRRAPSHRTTCGRCSSTRRDSLVGGSARR